MAGIPVAEQNALIDRNYGVTPSASRYAALTTTAPTSTTPGTEMTGTGYARQLITFSAAAAGVTSNTNAPVFTNSGGTAWAEAVGLEIYTALTGGTRVFWDTAETPKTNEAGDDITIAIGAVDYSWSA